VFHTRAAAEAALRQLDDAAGLPRTHREGTGPDDYYILNPGEAAASIRAAGVRTEHLYEIVASDDRQRFGLCAPDHPSAVEIDVSDWWPPRSRPGPILVREAVD
jgi:hypothetical protein